MFIRLRYYVKIDVLPETEEGPHKSERAICIAVRYNSHHISDGGFKCILRCTCNSRYIFGTTDGNILKPILEYRVDFVSRIKKIMLYF